MRPRQGEEMNGLTECCIKWNTMPSMHSAYRLEKEQSRLHGCGSRNADVVLAPEVVGWH